MNKYQEALNELSYPLEDSSCGGCKCGESDCSCEKRIAVETLQELVDRATPKKPEMMRIKKYDGYNIGICECGNTIDTSLDDCANFCPNCGQALDWVDE